jgi:indole-3-glycerol phosphate synthase
VRTWPIASVAALAQLESAAKAASSPRGFKAALEGHAPGKLALIAEIKKASPSKGLIRADFDPPALARNYEAGGAACLSVLTDGPSFQGADAYLIDARAAVQPALHPQGLPGGSLAGGREPRPGRRRHPGHPGDDRRRRGRRPDGEAKRLGMDALVEVHDEAEMDRAGQLGSTLVGINNRDLKSFVVDLAVTERLAAQAPKDALLVTDGSGLFVAADAVRMEAAGAKAMLVGESLMRQADVAAAGRTWLAGPRHRSCPKR